MRSVANRARPMPVQEQEVINKFVTSAPGLPLAKCGKGVLAECVNMDIKPDRLELRKPMRKLGNAEGGYLPVVNLKTVLSTQHGVFYIGGNAGNTLMYRGVGNFGTADVDTRLELKKCFGDLNLLCYCKGGRKTGLTVNEKKKEWREVGMPIPGSIAQGGIGYGNYPEGLANVDRRRYIGVEYVVKQMYNGESVVVRSSGIKRSKTPLQNNLLIHTFSLPESTTHVRVWMTDWIKITDTFKGKLEYEILNSELFIEMMRDIIRANEDDIKKEKEKANPDQAYINNRQTDINSANTHLKTGMEAKAEAKARMDKYSSPNSGTPEEMYLIFEFALDGGWGSAVQSPNGAQNYLPKKASLVYKNEDSNEQWEGRIYKAVNDFDYFFLKWTETDFEPSEFSLEVTANEEGKPLEVINVERMPNAIHYSGGRLWGVLDDTKIIWSLPAGTPEHEQWDPLAYRDLGLGEIKSIESLNGDIYAFCVDGVAMIPGGDPNREPFCISTIGGNAVRTFCFDGFGCFAVIDEKLYFLDQQTRAFTMNCNGLDLNMLLGDLAGSIKDMAVYAGDFYFIVATEKSKIFKASLKEGCGFSEIAVKNSGLPISLCAVDGGLLIAFYQNFVGGIFWVIEGQAKSNAIIEEDIDYKAMFVKNALHGWVEHWDTAVYAKLPKEFVIGTTEICDGLTYYPTRQDQGEGKPHGWDYKILAGRDKGVKRPIGKTIGIGLFIVIHKDTLKNIYDESEEKPVIMQAQITTLKQEEYINPRFAPNDPLQADGLATQDYQILVTEDH